MAATKTQLAFRLPSELVDRIDRYWRAIARRTAAADMTRSDVVRQVLRRGLAELEREERAARRTSRKTAR